MKQGPRQLAWVVGMLSAFACSDGTSPVSATNRPIVFIGRRQIPGQFPRESEIAIYSVRLDGSGLQRLTTGAGQALYPAWSRDGRQIAFASGPVTAGGGTQLWAMAPDGTNAHRLSSSFGECPYGYESLTWDPSGSRLAAECFWTVAVFDLATETVTPVSAGLEDSMENPDWSPDGKRIAFDDPFLPDVFVQAPAVDKRTTLIADASDPAWSPNGTRIAFAGRSTPGIFVAAADGTGRTRLTTPTGTDRDEGPTWSPDGQWLAFHRSFSSTWSVFVVRSDGSGLRRVVPDSLTATRPSW
jgi:Tol biopolymer transport system component